MAFSFAPQLAFLAGPLGAISAGRQYLKNVIGEGHIFLTLHRTMTTEYTVLQVQNPRDERHKVRRQDDSFKEVMGQAIRAINAYLRPGQALRAR